MRKPCPHCKAVENGSWSPVKPSSDCPPISALQRREFDAIAYCWAVHDDAWGDGMPVIYAVLQAHGLRRDDLYHYPKGE